MMYLVLMALACATCGTGDFNVEAYLARATFPSGGSVLIGGVNLQNCEMMRTLFTDRVTVTPCVPVTITDRKRPKEDTP